jgi:hypothetical protein
MRWLMPRLDGEVADHRRDGERGEIAIDHGRHTGENLRAAASSTLRTPVLAYWVRKIALIRPSGMATIMAMIAPMKIVPQNSGIAP